MKKAAIPEFPSPDQGGNTRILRGTGREKTAYVFGHRNPDTDSAVSAAAYANLKQALGMGNCVAARAGKASPQTEYIFARFQVPLPEFIPDLMPKVGYYYNPNCKTVNGETSLWDAMAVLQTNEASILPVVDGEGRYLSLLHYRFFAQSMLKMCNPRRKTAIRTSISLLASVLHAETPVLNRADELRTSPIIVASAEFDTFKTLLATHPAENTIVITGNREEIQDFAIKAGVRSLVVTNGDMPNRRLRESAERKGVSLLISPYDTSSTTMLILYSMPVSGMSNADVRPVKKDETLRKIAPALAAAPGKALPVVDDAGVVAGILTEADLYHDPNIEIILVDHNEPSQAVEGVENYRILEIIDHHRLGAMPTRHPITFINKPVGATSTIVAGLYRENHVPLTSRMASILLCGILADTLVLQSATTTREDREMAEDLANIADLDIDSLGRDLMRAASNIAGRPAAELIRQDMKTYDENGCSFVVSQVEVGSLREALARKAEFLEELERERAAAGALFAAILITDITLLSSIMIMAAEPGFAHFVNLPKQEESVYDMKDVVSRKKQLLPILSELAEEYRRR
ncbi:MAG: putative manganese-dependent inorganic diphosphatase [Planctomycetota bacterium]|jgi:manganese-dependent inorganic pyrophosphatase|nr:putative manganese-dependent inorganic diphosphatase [Planctomycetota bacterium]